MKTYDIGPVTDTQIRRIILDHQRREARQLHDMTTPTAREWWWLAGALTLLSAFAGVLLGVAWLVTKGY